MAVARRTDRIFTEEDPLKWVFSTFDFFYTKVVKPAMEQGESGGGGGGDEQRRVAEVLQGLSLPPDVIEAVKFPEVLQGWRLPDEPEAPSWMEFLEAPSPPPNLDYADGGELAAVGRRGVDMAGKAGVASPWLYLAGFAVLGLVGYSVYWLMKRNRRGEAVLPGANGAEPPPGDDPPAAASSPVSSETPVGRAKSPARDEPTEAPHSASGATSLDMDDFPPELAPMKVLYLEGSQYKQVERTSGSPDQLTLLNPEKTHYMIPWFERPIYDVHTHPDLVESTSESRELHMAVSRDIRKILTERASNFNIALDDVSITSLSFGKEFTHAIEAKQVAALEAERAKFIVEKSEQEKRSEVTRAQGEAKSAQLIGEAIDNNPAFLALRQIEAAREISNTKLKQQGVPKDLLLGLQQLNKDNKNKK